MSKRRFYCDSPISESANYQLEGPEHQHLAKVLRAQPGEEVILFDGSGIECRAIIDSVERNSTELSIVDRARPERELPADVTLAVALPKGDRQQWLVEKVVELGVTKLLPLKTEFGVAQPNEKACQRIRRQIIAASKQCGRNVLMQLLEPTKLDDFLRVAQASDACCVVAHPGGDPVREVFQRQLLAAETPQDVALLVGPEGGFSVKEIERATGSGCQIISLGPRILRIETAAVVLASGFLYA